MKVYKKDELKMLIVFSLMLMIISGVVLYVINRFENKVYINNSNEEFAGFIYKISNGDKELEKKVLRNLNNYSKEDVKNGKELLNKYGYNNKYAYNEKVNNKINSNIKNYIYLFLLIITIFTLIIIIFIKKREQQVKKTLKYIKEIENKNYSLKLEDETEGELSNLQSELYKMTVMLKENAEISKDKQFELEKALSDISHQIKTPLTSISVMVDILKDENMPKEKRKEFVSEISKQVDWISWLVVSLLKLSKLDSGSIVLKRENINVKGMLNEINNKLAIPIEINNQKINIDCEESIEIIGDNKWTLEAILNIVKNCLEHSFENKDVDIKVKNNLLYTEIIIKDYGKGISKDDITHIFERFYKGDNSSENSIGIGLALAQGIMKKQGGDITVHSKLGEGSEFKIKIFKGVV